MRTSLALSILLLVACHKDAPTTFSAINAQIFQPSCAAFSTCHSVEGFSNAGHLNLKTDPYAALVNVLSDNPMAKSEGLLRVKPGDSDASFLHTKLHLNPIGGVCQDPGGTVVGYGACMPLSSAPLDHDQIEGIATWIDNGALNN